MSAPRPYYPDEPVIIYVVDEADGVSFALDPLSRDYLRATLPKDIHVWPRIFIAEETRDQLKNIDTSVQRQVVTFLTGLSPEVLQQKYNGVCFINSRRGTESWHESQDLPQARENPPRAIDSPATGAHRS